MSSNISHGTSMRCSIADDHILEPLPIINIKLCRLLIGPPIRLELFISVMNFYLYRLFLNVYYL